MQDGVKPLDLSRLSSALLIFIPCERHILRVYGFICSIYLCGKGAVARATKFANEMLPRAVKLWCSATVRRRARSTGRSASGTRAVLLTDMRRPFKDKKGAADFNDDISGWDVSNVKNMNWTFSGSTSFNQPLEKWDVSKVEDMEGTFHSARAFNQPRDKWDVSSVATSTRMFV
jgi:surface protein